MPKKTPAVLAPRRAPDPDAVEAFIGGESRLRKTTSLKPQRVTVERKDGRRVRRTTIYMEEELARRVGIFAVKRDVDQTQVIKVALEEYLAKHGG